MATLREIRRRIGGVKSTQKITKAMKMVAAAKLRRAQDAMISARPYAKKMKELLQHLAGTMEENVHPLMVARPVERVALVVITSDRGLCGAFNTNILKAAVNHIRTNYKELNEAGHLKVTCVGRKGYDYFIKRKQYDVGSKHVGIFGALAFNHARTIAEELVQGFVDGEFDRVELVYNEFKSIMQQKITVEQFLPIPAEEIGKDKKTEHAGDYIYEPTATELVRTLVPKHLNFQVWRSLLESNAAEQGARMTAMDQATTNATDLIRTLQLSYNKARQASITKELLEIVSGAEALKKSA